MFIIDDIFFPHIENFGRTASDFRSLFNRQIKDRNPKILKHFAIIELMHSIDHLNRLTHHKPKRILNTICKPKRLRNPHTPSRILLNLVFKPRAELPYKQSNPPHRFDLLPHLSNLAEKLMRIMNGQDRRTVRMVVDHADVTDKLFSQLTIFRSHGAHYISFSTLSDRSDHAIFGLTHNLKEIIDQVVYVIVKRQVLLIKWLINRRRELFEIFRKSMC